MTHTSTEQPEAQRLLDWFEESGGFKQGTQANHKWVLQAEQELRRLNARVQELEAEKARLIEAFVPCPIATEAYMYGITQEKQG